MASDIEIAQAAKLQRISKVANNVALRVDFGADATFRALLGRVGSAVFEALNVRNRTQAVLVAQKRGFLPSVPAYANAR